MQSHGKSAEAYTSVPIRSLYVVPMRPQMSGEMKEYLQRFGAVETIHSRGIGDYNEYGVVQFQSAEDARTVLSIGSHRIENWNFEVSAADLWHQPGFQQPFNPLLVAPEQDSPSNILIALNDDCLHMVIRHLNVKDLTNAAEACVRFNAQAKDTFARQHLEVDLSYKALDPAELNSLFNNFGSLISSLKASKYQFKSAKNFIRVAGMHLTSRLKYLELEILDITEQFRPLFASLESLQLNCCTIECNMKNLMSECTELKVLKVHPCYRNENIDIKFNQIEEASFRHMSGLRFDNLNSFLKLNPTLKKLAVYIHDIEPSRIIRAVSESLPNLIELDISWVVMWYMADQNNITDDVLSRLKLKVFKLRFASIPIATLLNNMGVSGVPIEHLFIDGTFSNDTIDGISKMKKIKFLELHLSFAQLNDEDLIKLAKKLPDLQEFRYYNSNGDSQLTIAGLKEMLHHATKLSFLRLTNISSIKIDVDDYNVMLDIVQNRPEKINLSIELSDGRNRYSDCGILIGQNGLRYNFYSPKN